MAKRQPDVIKFLPRKCTFETNAPFSNWNGNEKIIDYKPPFIIDISGIGERWSFRVTDNRFEYYGYYQECKKK